MRKFFIDRKNINNKKVIITDQEVHHMKDVIRLRPNDRFIGLDGQGSQYICKINKIDNNRIEAGIESKSKIFVKIPKIALACAIPKASKMDYIVQKATELGVQNLIPMQTDRTEVKFNEQKCKTKIKRWERIAKESSKQCGRSGVLEISEIKKFNEAVEASNIYKTKIIPYIGSETKPIKYVLQQLRLDSVIILIGPEGDFTPGEIKFAINAGFIPVSLGPLVLRVDTAAIFTLSVIMNKLFSNENI